MIFSADFTILSMISWSVLAYFQFIMFVKEHSTDYLVCVVKYMTARNHT